MHHIKVITALLMVSMLGCLIQRSPVLSSADIQTVDANGSRVSDIFNGNAPNSRLTPASLKQMQDMLRITGSTGCQPQSGHGLLQRLFSVGDLQAVHAQSSCQNQNCTGQYYGEYLTPCTRIDCGGNRYEVAAGGGSVVYGFRQTGALGCNKTGCGCETRICNDCGPSRSCPPGNYCLNNTCHACASCDVLHPCVGINQQTCVQNCCEEVACQTNDDCDMQHHCSNGICIYSYCSPGLQHACHDAGDCTSDYSCNSNGCCQSNTPIVIDIEGDGYSLTSADDGVLFDLAGTGEKVRLAWTAPGSDDAWLCLDRNGNGIIDDGLELFGSFTPQPKTPKEKNGFEALAVFDQRLYGGNGDGKIDKSDSVFSRLLLWQDRNHDGVSNSGELLTLSQAGVTAVSLEYKETPWVDVFGNQFRYRARVERPGAGKGTVKWAFDVILLSAGVGK